MMGVKVYVLLDVMDGKSEEVAQILRGKPGVVKVDQLEGPPEVITVVEAYDRQELADLTMQALASVETMTEGLQLLPTRGRCYNR